MLKKVFRDSFVYFATLVLGKLLTAVFFIILARVFLPEKFGEVTYFITLLQLISALADLGLKQFFQKKMAIDAHSWLFTQITLLRLLSFGLTVIVVIALWAIFPSLIVGLGWLLICLLMEALFTVADAFYLSEGKAIRLGQKLIARNLLLFGYLTLIWWGGIKSVDSFYAFYTAITALILLFYFPYRALNFKKLDFSRAKIKHLLGRTSIYWVMDGCSMTYSKADSVVIKNTLGSAALGVYGSAYRFLESFNLLPQALFHNLFTISSRQDGVSRRQLKIMMAVMGGLGAVIGAGIMVIARPLIVWTMGIEYAEAVPVMRIFGIVIFLFFLNSPMNIIIQSSNMLKKYLPWVVGNVVLNIVLNLIFVSMTGSILAAAEVMIASEVLSIALNAVFVKRIYSQKN